MDLKDSSWGVASGPELGSGWWGQEASGEWRLWEGVWWWGRLVI